MEGQASGMSIRDDVLAAVSDALTSRPAEVTVDRSYRVVPQTDDVLDLFCERQQATYGPATAASACCLCTASVRA
jgi:hypothetical protein